MQKYKVMLNGQNFVIDPGEGLAKYGFYSTCYVTARSKAEAEASAIDVINKRQDIKGHIQNEQHDPPMMYAEEIVEVDNIEDDPQELSWFREAF